MSELATADVTELSIGDAVLGVAPGCLGHTVFSTSGTLVLKPSTMSFDEAATAPTVYCTVFTAFDDGTEQLGPCHKVSILTFKIRANLSNLAGIVHELTLVGPFVDQVLVHAGAGGVGLAAVRVATALGCQVYSTAGSAQKRSFLRDKGVESVGNSRDASFPDVLTCGNPSGV